jgi:hypothetical protein
MAHHAIYAPPAHIARSGANNFAESKICASILA